MENLLDSWREFLRGKRKRKDVAEFSLDFTDNILMLHRELKEKTYEHGGYEAFKISDPKPRDIHKASVRDRLVHHAIYRVLYPYFDRKFIHDSYSCRIGKGAHRAVNRFRDFARKTSGNNTRTAWALKGDIRKFFASIDHAVLKNILAKHVDDQDVLWLLDGIIGSFSSPPTPLLIRRGEGAERRGEAGLPLGNLTSQLLVNIYMNEFDQFMKRELKVRRYIRYADDFAVISESRSYLQGLIPGIADFLDKHLGLSLHPDKVFIKTISSGVDFLGWVNFPEYRILRTSTKRRMMRRIENHSTAETANSYLGLLKHGNAKKIRDKIEASCFSE